MSEYEQVIDEIVKHGVVVKINKVADDNYIPCERKYVGCVVELDFTEHDKVFEDKIEELEKRIQELDTIDAIRIDEKRELKQRIAGLESKETETCRKEPVSDDYRPSMEWYDNRHQSDCIEINRLNTTIDVLIHKVEYLRQFAGLE